MSEFLSRNDDITGASSLTEGSILGDEQFDENCEDLWSKLHELESMTSKLTESFKLAIPIGKDLFVDVGGHHTDSSTQTVTVQVPELHGRQCLSLSAVCVAPYGEDDDTFLDQGPRKENADHNRLEIRLACADVEDESLRWTASYFRSEYTIMIDGSEQRIPAGSYTITIANQGPRLSSVRINVRVIERTPAIEIHAGERLRHSNGNGEFTYFRFERTDPRKLVTIRAQPISDDHGPIGDPDLYVSNRFCGFVPVTKDSFVWKSTNVGADRYVSV